MPAPLFFFEAVRRKLLEHQDRPRRSKVPMWRLLWWEVTHGVGRLFDRSVAMVWVPAAVVALLVLLGLGPWTPGPVLDAVWRSLLALVAAILTASVAVALRSRVTRHG